MVKLSLADKKILSLMEYDPRISYKELATACHLSKDTIKYRIKRLEKEKIILGYTCLVDYKRLGKDSYKLYLKINNTEQEKESMKAYLRKQKSIFAIFDSSGNWNLAVAMFAKDAEEFNEIENEMLEKFGKLIVNRKFCLMIDAEVYKRDYLQDKKDKFEILRIWDEKKDEALDDKDIELIKAIHKNSSDSLVNLSNKIKLSIDSTKNRIKRLNEKKIIAIYKTNINYELLGFDKYKLLIYPGNYLAKTEANLINFLRNEKSCVNLIRTIGPWKLEAEFMVIKIQDMENILSRLNELFKGQVQDLEFSILRNEEILPCEDLFLE